MRGTVFFSSNDGVHGRELWKSDGTSGGTTLVTDLNPAGDGVSWFNFYWGNYAVNADGVLLFDGVDGQGHGLFRSDGTASGTTLVARVASWQFTPVNEVVLFSGYVPDHGWELWRTDGTSAGTTLVGGGAGHLTVADERLFFTAWPGSGFPDSQLWTYTP